MLFTGAQGMVGSCKCELGFEESGVLELWLLRVNFIQLFLPFSSHCWVLDLGPCLGYLGALLVSTSQASMPPCTLPF